MGPPRSYNNTEVALFITATQPVDPGLLAELNTTADKWAQSDGTLHVFADDGAGHDFKGWSHQQLALWTVHHLGGDGTSSLTSQCATGAIAVLDDQGVAQRYVEIVGLDMDWPDKFSPAQISQAIAHNGFLDGLVKDTLKVDFKYAIDIPFLLDSDWKGIESYKEYTEGEPGNVLRKFSEETDPDEIEIDTGERVTVRLE